MHMCSYMWSWHLRLDETHKTRSVVNDVVQSFGHENHVSGFQIVRPFLAQNSAPFAATDSHGSGAEQQLIAPPCADAIDSWDLEDHSIHLQTLFHCIILEGFGHIQVLVTGAVGIGLQFLACDK